MPNMLVLPTVGCARAHRKNMCGPSIHIRGEPFALIGACNISGYLLQIDVIRQHSTKLARILYVVAAVVAAVVVAVVAVVAPVVVVVVVVAAPLSLSLSLSTHTTVIEWMRGPGLCPLKESKKRKEDPEPM